MRAEKKVIDGIIPGTTTNAVYIDGTNKTLDETLNKYVIEENKNEQIKIWIGTAEEYTSLSVKNENTLYFLK